MCLPVPVRARQMPRLARSAEGSNYPSHALCRAGSKYPGIKPLVPTHCNAATFTLPRCESSCRAGRCAGGRAAGFARSRSPARRLLPPRATPQSTHPLHASDWIDAAIRRAGVGRICRAAARVHGAPASVGRTDGQRGGEERVRWPSGCAEELLYLRFIFPELGSTHTLQVRQCAATRHASRQPPAGVRVARQRACRVAPELVVCANVREAAPARAPRPVRGAPVPAGPPPFLLRYGRRWEMASY